ncbi:hypothetical protein [Paenibacillus sp. SN-8-1]|uniref:hypothetical protein n=1 Tax=Paenibacillus sp. SN-8-1 TaxID=3435409 RepID=UPI003D9AB41C
MITENDRAALQAAIDRGETVTIVHMDESATGIPSWGEDRSRVKIKTGEGAVWVPLDEIKHVTRIIQLNAKKDLTSS